MKANDTDPVKRWRAIADFYTEFASMKHMEFLTPMISLAEWAGKQSSAALKGSVRQLCYSVLTSLRRHNCRTDPSHFLNGPLILPDIWDLPMDLGRK